MNIQIVIPFHDILSNTGQFSLLNHLSPIIINCHQLSLEFFFCIVCTLYSSMFCIEWIFGEFTHTVVHGHQHPKLEAHVIFKLHSVVISSEAQVWVVTPSEDNSLTGSNVHEWVCQMVHWIGKQPTVMCPSFPGTMQAVCSGSRAPLVFIASLSAMNTLQ